MQRSGLDLGRFQRLGGQAFDRIAIQIFDSHVGIPLEAGAGLTQIKALIPSPE